MISIREYGKYAIERALVVILVALLVCSSNAQQDTSFCDTSTITPVQPAVPYPNLFIDINMQYQLVIEQNRESEKATSEVFEYYDGLANKGIVYADTDGVRVATYAYYDTNELFIVRGDNCILMRLNETTTQFHSTIIDGKLHIANMEYLIKDLQKIYVGENTIRGIPVQTWQTCLYDSSKQTTYKLSISFSNPDKWIPAIGSVNQSVHIVPVEIRVESKTKDGQLPISVFSYTNFKAGLLTQEEDYLTPPGVYCQGRVNRKPLPMLKPNFSYKLNVLEAIPQTSGLFGTKYATQTSYDSVKQLFRIDYVLHNQDMYAVHDFNTGLKYTMNKNSRSCNITRLNETDLFDDGGDLTNGNFHLKDPIDFFGINATAAQYVGQRRVNGINADVWIAPKKIGNQDTYMEWYFQADQWITQESAGIITNEPICIKIYYKTKVPGTSQTVNVDLRYNIYDYDSTRIDDFDFNINSCLDQIRNTRVSFRLDVDDRDQLQEISRSIDVLKKAIVYTLIDKTGVSNIRITNVDAVFENNSPDQGNGIYVRFNLLERPSFYGNAESKDQVPLDDVIVAMKNAILQDTFIISFNNSDSNRFDVKVQKSSIRTGNSFDDGPFCLLSNFVADPKNLSLPALSPLSQFQLTVEKNVLNERLTQEINEFYDGIANIGYAIVDAAGLRTYIYAYYMTNELLLIEGEKCLVKALNESVGLSPFQVVNTENGEHITTPLSYFLSLSDVQFVYTGSHTTKRGIPVNQWSTCYKSEKEKKTYKITISYSDPDKWTPAIGVYHNKTNSVPVETEIETEDEAGVRTREVHVITKFKLGLLLNEQDYGTPPGVYCEGRKNSKQIPDIPNEFRFRGEIVEAIPKTNELFGVITSVREGFDMKKNLFRLDYNYKGFPVYEVHDFNNGLRYFIEKYSQKCNITELTDGIDTESDNLNLRIRNPFEFFDLDTTALQYVGLRPLKGANTEVWISPKKLDGKDAILEWYFLTDQWVTQEALSVKTNELVQINIYTKESIVDNKNKTELVTQIKRYNIYDFDSSRIDDLDFDLRRCLDVVKNNYVAFDVPASKRDLIRANLVSFKKGVIDAVMATAGVSRLRIANVDVITTETDKDLTVIFNLMEKPSMYGKVNETTKDKVKLNDALDRLQKSIDKDKFTINFKSVSIKEESINGIKNSFQASITKIRTSVERSDGVSTTVMAIAVVVSVVLSLAVGIVATVFYRRFQANRRSTNIPISMGGLTNHD